MLETALQASPSTIVTAEPFLFNLCECAISVCAVFALISGCLPSSHTVRAPFDGRCRQETRAPHRSGEVGWRWPSHYLPEDAEQLIPATSSVPESLDLGRKQHDGGNAAHHPGNGVARGMLHKRT